MVKIHHKNIFIAGLALPQMSTFRGVVRSLTTFTLFLPQGPNVGGPQVLNRDMVIISFMGARGERVGVVREL
jgi:hypothetical protein